MKKKLTISQKRLIICLVVLMIFAAAYQFVYVKIENMTDSYKNRTDEVKQQIKLIKTELAQEDSLTVKLKETDSRINDIIDTYPVNISKEDDLVFIEKLEQKLKIDIPSVNILDNTVFYTTILPIRDENGEEIAIKETANSTGTEGTVEAAAVVTPSVNSTATDGDTTSVPADATAQSATAEISSQYMTGLLSQISINFQISEADFIKLVEYIDNYSERVSIDSTSLSYDSTTGELTGSMTINRYALTGTGKVYNGPDIGNISIGTDNLFGTKAE